MILIPHFISRSRTRDVATIERSQPVTGPSNVRVPVIVIDDDDPSPSSKGKSRDRKHLRPKPTVKTLGPQPPAPDSDIIEVSSGDEDKPLAKRSRLVNDADKKRIEALLQVRPCQSCIKGTSRLTKVLVQIH